MVGWERTQQQGRIISENLQQAVKANKNGCTAGSDATVVQGLNNYFFCKGAVVPPFSLPAGTIFHTAPRSLVAGSTGPP